MDITNTMGPNIGMIKAMAAFWDAIFDWFSDDEDAVPMAASSYQATAPTYAPVSGTNGAPLPVIARDCNSGSIPPENIELRHSSVNSQSSSGCTYVKNTSATKALVPEKPECRAAYIPFEAIEYRYGNTNGMMNLPICSR